MPGGPAAPAARPRRRTLADFVGLAGSVLLVGAAFVRLPPASDLFRTPETPFDYTQAGEAVQIFLFLTEAASRIPAGASVSVRSNPPDRIAEERWRRFAQALLPGRRVEWSSGAPADILLVPGPRPDSPSGTLLYETPTGGVWKTAPR
ncbi:MAG: hypothetical protein ABJC61_12540 [Acidobacteriota bacterium]